MRSYRVSAVMVAFLLAVLFALQVDQGWAQKPKEAKPKNELAEATNAAAQKRKSEGLRRGTTNDDRKAAAKNAADRKAEHRKKLQQKGGATQ